MPERRPLRPRLAIGTHLGVVLVAGSFLVGSRPTPAWFVGAIASGAILFALTRLIRQAGRRRFAREAPAKGPLPSVIPEPRWAGRAAIRARPRRQHHY